MRALTELTGRARAGAARTRRPRAGVTTAYGATPPLTRTTRPPRSGRSAQTQTVPARSLATATGLTVGAGRASRARTRSPLRMPVLPVLLLARCLMPPRPTRAAPRSVRARLLNRPLSIKAVLAVPVCRLPVPVCRLLVRAATARPWGLVGTVLVARSALVLAGRSDPADLVGLVGRPGLAVLAVLGGREPGARATGGATGPGRKRLPSPAASSPSSCLACSAPMSTCQAAR
jgi:hypothetical protein